MFYMECTGEIKLSGCMTIARARNTWNAPLNELRGNALAFYDSRDIWLFRFEIERSASGRNSDLVGLPPRRYFDFNFPRSIDRCVCRVLSA